MQTNIKKYKPSSLMLFIRNEPTLNKAFIMYDNFSEFKELIDTHFEYTVEQMFIVENEFKSRKKQKFH